MLDRKAYAVTIQSFQTALSIHSVCLAFPIVAVTPRSRTRSSCCARPSVHDYHGRCLNQSRCCLNHGCRYLGALYTARTCSPSGWRHAFHNRSRDTLNNTRRPLSRASDYVSKCRVPAIRKFRSRLDGVFDGMVCTLSFNDLIFLNATVPVQLIEDLK